MQTTGLKRWPLVKSHAYYKPSKAEGEEKVAKKVWKLTVSSLRYGLSLLYTASITVRLNERKIIMLDFVKVQIIIWKFSLFIFCTLNHNLIELNTGETHLLASSPPGGRLGMDSDANVRITWTKSGTPSSPCFLIISVKDKIAIC